MTNKPELKVSVISDYACPFCFIGHHRLQQLKNDYDLKINWCLVEIHPETPASGRPVSELNYSDQQWQQMQDSLQQLASSEQIQLADIVHVPNSRRALMLAEASKSLGAERFYPLHNSLFEACFVRGQDIGNESLLREIANRCNIPEQLVDLAWSDPHSSGPAEQVPMALRPYLQFAASIRARSVPTFIFGKELLTGVVEVDTFRQIAAQMSG